MSGSNFVETPEALERCVIGDGDTGFGGSGNVRRTVRGYADAGALASYRSERWCPNRYTKHQQSLGNAPPSVAC